jgi:uncharacterized protein (DUF1919 family)
MSSENTTMSKSAFLQRVQRGARERSRSAYETLYLALARWRLRHKDFSIISNKCWGAHVYQKLRRIYTTPFVGLFIPPSCYLTLLSDLKQYMQADLAFVEKSRHDAVNKLREGRRLDYPIGLLGSAVEIHFMHFDSLEKARGTWERRKRRLCPQPKNLFFKFCDHDGASQDQLHEFDRLPYVNKVCFTGTPYSDLRSGVYVPGSSEGRVPDGGALATVSPAHFNALAWLEGKNPRRVPLCGGVL